MHNVIFVCDIQDQCCLALSLMERFSKREISEVNLTHFSCLDRDRIQFNNIQYFQIISSKVIDSKINDSCMFVQNNQADSVVGVDLSKELGSERIKNVFFNIEKACINEKVHQWVDIIVSFRLLILSYIFFQKSRLKNHHPIL